MWLPFPWTRVWFTIPFRTFIGQPAIALFIPFSDAIPTKWQRIFRRVARLTCQTPCTLGQIDHQLEGAILVKATTKNEQILEKFKDKDSPIWHLGQLDAVYNNSSKTKPIFMIFISNKRGDIWLSIYINFIKIGLELVKIK